MIATTPRLRDACSHRLPFGKRLDAERTARAQSYAYHFFFRRMIQLPGLRARSARGALRDRATRDGGVCARGVSRTRLRLPRCAE